jgi:arylsulfatase A-like enzyme/dienelactone hydrolase
MSSLTPTIAAADKPNVVIILADDLGYGDVSCYNPERGKIPTPNIDALATGGMRFTDAHSSSGVCSPTRYALLTGRYHWRTRLQQGIVGVWGAPLIAADRLTVAGLAKQHGYHTACVGKWHLGWDWPISADDKKHFQGLGGKGNDKAETEPTADQVAAWKKVFAQKLPGGPTARGFDEYFGTDVPNWPPYCFIENDRTVGIPTVLLPANDFTGNQASLQGPALPEWKLDAVLPALADRACEIITKLAKAKTPFLLYLPLTAPHTPIAVAKEWQGKSSLKHPYADFVMQTDAVVGRVLDTLKAAGVEGDTLVVFTSDNGCAPYIGAKNLESLGHFPSGPLRGYKADAWEGGHRVPFVVRWPGMVKPGSICSQTICSVDVLATLADVLGAKLPATAAEDSVSLMPLLRGGDKPIHEAVVHHSSTGVFAVRSGKWKLILGPGSGATDGTKPHLYDLTADIGEKTDLAAKHQEEVKRLTELMEKFVADGRSTPGEKQKNDVPVQIVKKAKADPPPKKEAPSAPKNLVYKEASGDKLQLHVHAPADARPGDNRTAIVFFFGGGWSGWNPTQFEPFARHFAGLGCVAICADYRVSSRHKTTPTDAVRDAKSAVRYVREHAKEWGADPNRIVAAGGSAGGHLAACTALVPGFLDEKGAKDADTTPNALVLFNPVLDTSAAGFGGAKRGDELKPISPQHHVREKLPPVLVLHGTADTTVPFKQVEAFAKAMKDAGNVCEVEAFEGRGHGFFNHPDFRKGAKPDDYEACVKRVTKFLEAQKLLPAQLPSK